MSNYLREIVCFKSPRTFSVDVEPLAGDKTIFRTFWRPLHASGAAQYRSADGRYSPCVSPFYARSARHPVPGPGIQGSRRCSNIAALAPLLPVDLRDDFSAFFDECLVRAVELRLRRLSPAELSSALDQAEGNGYVLVRSIYAGLSGFEKSEPAMGYDLPDLIKGIDVAAEQRRLRGVKFTEAAPPRRGPARKHPDGGEARCIVQIPWMTIWPKGSGKFPRGMARLRQRPLNECSRRIPMTSARRTASR